MLHPLKRSGPKGTGQFERISWDEAVEMIRDRWTGIINTYGPTAILPYSYLGTEGILNGLNVGDAFFNRLGATISERTFCDSDRSPDGQVRIRLVDITGLDNQANALNLGIIHRFRNLGRTHDQLDAGSRQDR